MSERREGTTLAAAPTITRRTAFILGFASCLALLAGALAFSWFVAGGDQSAGATPK